MTYTTIKKFIKGLNDIGKTKFVQLKGYKKLNVHQQMVIASVVSEAIEKRVELKKILESLEK